VKIIAKDLDKALAGLPVYSAEREDEIEYYKVNCSWLLFRGNLIEYNLKQLSQSIHRKKNTLNMSKLR
jgi:hypothetical protein